MRTVSLLILVAAASTAGTSSARPPGAATPVERIAVPGEGKWDYARVDPAAGHLYVAQSAWS